LEPVAAEIEGDAEQEAKSVIRVESGESGHDKSSGESVGDHIEDNT
jgi:hypothetical protein